MTFREFNLTILKDAILGTLLPLELRRTFPWFSLEGETLCMSFAGFRIAPARNAVKAFPPAYYLKITYPGCLLLSYEKLSASEDITGGLMTPRAPEEIRRLTELCDHILELCDRGSDGLEPAVSEYNALLRTVLEPGQLAVLERFGNR